MPDDATSILILALALLAPPLTGCLSGDPGSVGSTSPPTGDPGVEIPRPAEGSWYNYTGQDKRLNVTVGVVDNRTDPWLRERPALLLQIDHWPGGRYDDWYDLESAVDPWTGLLVSQWADCGSQHADRPDGCLDERAKWFGSAHGYPGALGAAPLWGTALEPGELNRSLPTVVPGNDDWNRTIFEPTGASARAECLRVEPVGEADTARARALKFNGGLADFTVCEGVGLPVAFTSHAGTTYRLQAHETRTAEPPQADRPDLAEDPQPPLDLVERSPPVLVESPELDSPFPETEAHEVALERSDPYADLFESGDDPAVVETKFRRNGGSDGGVLGTSSERWEHNLEAVDATGLLVEVTVQKTIRNGPGGETETTYEVTEEDRGSLDPPVPTASSWAPRQAHVGQAIELGEELTEQPGKPNYWKYRVVRTSPWFVDEWPPRLDGPTLITWHEDPSPCQEPQNGLQITCPYHAVWDGPTGTALWVSGDRATLSENLR